MRITKADTAGFDGYEVKKFVPTRCWWWPWVPHLKEEIVKGVIEADEATGLLVAQVFTKAGEAVYTNGSDDIYLSNTVRLMMLVPPIREAFVRAGFRPKTETTWGNALSIHNRNSTNVLKVVETDAPSPLEAREAEHVNVG